MSSPVVDQGRVQSIATNIAVAGVAVGAIAFPGVDLTPVQETALAATSAVVILVNTVATVITSVNAKGRVTPVANPRDDYGRRLVPEGDL